jgi:hypothetical protein
MLWVFSSSSLRCLKQKQNKRKQKSLFIIYTYVVYIYYSFFLSFILYTYIVLLFIVRKFPKYYLWGTLISPLCIPFPPYYHMIDYWGHMLSNEGMPRGARGCPVLRFSLLGLCWYGLIGKNRTRGLIDTLKHIGERVRLGCSINTLKSSPYK